MASPAAALRLKHQPVDVWSIRERLCLASSVLRSGDQNWVSVSRAIRQYGEPNRPNDWFSQKNCALQYSALLEKVETPKRKRGEKVDIETPGESIVRSLTQERIEELKKRVKVSKESYKRYKRKIEQLKSGQLDDQLDDCLTEIQEEKRNDEQADANHQRWLQEREEKKAAAYALLRTKGAGARLQRSPTKQQFSQPEDKSSETESSGGESSKIDSRASIYDFGFDETPPPITHSTIKHPVLLSPSKTGPLSIIPSVTAPASVSIPTSPLLTTLLKSPSPAAQTSAMLQSVIAQSMERVSNTTIGSLLSTSPSIPGSTPVQPSASSLLASARAADAAALAAVTSKTQVASNVQKDGDVYTQSSGAPTLNKLLELPLSQPGKLPPLPLVDTRGSVDDYPTPLRLEDRSSSENDIVDVVGADVDFLGEEASAILQEEIPDDLVIEVNNLMDLEEVQLDDIEAYAEEIVLAEQQGLSEIDTRQFVHEEEVPQVPTSLAQEVEVKEEEHPVEAAPTAIKKEVDLASELFDRMKETTKKSGSIKDSKKSPVKEESASSAASPRKSTGETSSKTSPASSSRRSSRLGTGGPVPALSLAAPTRTKRKDRTPTATPPNAESPVKDLATEEKVDENDSVTEKDAEQTPSRSDRQTPSTPSRSKRGSLIDAKEEKDSIETSSPRKQRGKSLRRDDAIQLSVVSSADEEQPEMTPLVSDAPLIQQQPMAFESDVLTTEDESTQSDRDEAGLMEAGSQLRTPKPSLSFVFGEKDSIPSSPSTCASPGVCDDPEASKEYKIWKKSIMLVWRAAANHKNANIFLNPVSADAAPGYFDIVRRPMDLLTVKRGVENGTIRTTVEFQREMMLIFVNAIFYNPSNHIVHKMAFDMQNDFYAIMQDFLETQSLVQASDVPVMTQRMLRDSHHKRTDSQSSADRAPVAISATIDKSGYNTPVVSDDDFAKRKRGGVWSETGSDTPSTSGKTKRKRQT